MPCVIIAAAAQREVGKVRFFDFEIELPDLDGAVKVVDVDPNVGGTPRKRFVDAGAAFVDGCEADFFGALAFNGRYSAQLIKTAVFCPFLNCIEQNL